MNEQSVILIHLNARLFTVKAVNSFNIFVLGHFCIFKMITRISDHYLFMFLEILVVESIFSLKSHPFIQSLTANYLNSLFFNPTVRFYVIVNTGLDIFMLSSNPVLCVVNTVRLIIFYA